MKRLSRPAVVPLEPRRLLSTYTVDAGGGGNYADLQTAMAAIPAGSTLLVGPGTYTGHTTVANPSSSVFWISKALTIRSTGGPAVTTLAVPAGQPQCVLVSSSDVTVDGFSLSHGQYCADVQDFQHDTTLTNVTLHDLRLTPDATAGHGILFQSVSASTIGDCTVGTSYANGIFLDAGSDGDTVANCTVLGTVTQHAIAVKNSTGDTVVGNTVTGSAADGIILVGSGNCHVAGNTVSGHKVDGIVLTGGSDLNTVELNAVTSDGLAAGRTDGVGIWVDSESDGNTVSANTVSGSPECGIDVFVSSDTTITGNDVSACGQGGIFVFDARGYPASVGNAPDHTVITGNDLHANPHNAGVILRGATDTDVERNAITGAYTGTYASSTDGGLTVERSSDTRFIGNTVLDVEAGVYAYADATGLQVYRNRFVHYGENYALAGAGATFDDSVTVGGNYWSKGMPGSPYTAFVYDTAGHLGGGYADGYPAAAESLGLPTAATVTGSPAGATVAVGSHRAITWADPAASRVDLYYTSAGTGDVLIAADRPNNGAFNWTVPATSAGSDYAIKVVPENGAGAAIDAPALGGTFAIDAGPVLLSPGPDTTAVSGGTVSVAWTPTGSAVSVQLQTADGGAWTTLAAGLTAGVAPVTLPALSGTTNRLRILDAAGDVDTQDGTLHVTGPAAVAPLPAAVQIGTTIPLAWTSPAGSATVTVQFWDGVAWQPIATGLPDVGHARWFVPERFTNGASVRVLFLNTANGQVGSATSDAFDIDYTLAPGTETAVYRLYSPTTLEHLYTTDANENATLATRGWNPEGVAYHVYTGPATVGGVAAEPEYRLYDAATRQHLWTTDRNEYLTLRTDGVWSPEGVAAYLFPTAVTGSTPLYRLSVTAAVPLHLWTTDANEYDTLHHRGWTQEGTIGSVLTS